MIITNYPQDKTEQLEAINNPEDPHSNKRMIPFTRELYIERDHFLEDPPKKFFRLSPGREVRLKHAYYITCTDLIKDSDGKIQEIHCTYDPKTKGGWSDDGRKVKGTLHWVSAKFAHDATVNLYDKLFTLENPANLPEGKTFTDALNPNSKSLLHHCKIEPELSKRKPGEIFQFLRKGYFIYDSLQDGIPVFNRSVGLRDSWEKIKKKINNSQ